MNKKQLAISLAILIALCIIVFNLLKSDNSTWNSGKYSVSGKELFSGLDVNKISKLAVSQGTESATIVKGDNGWTISEKGGYPADFKKIATFLGSLDSGKSIQDVKAGKSQLEKLSLGEGDKEKGSAALVEMSDESGKKAASILLGKMHFKKEESPNPFFGGSGPDGRYVMLLDGKFQPKLTSLTFEEIGASPVSWADKSFVEIDKIKSVDVKKKNAEESWKLEKKAEADSFALADLKDGEELDASKISALSSLLRNASFLDVSPLPAEFAGDTVVIETFDGFKYVVTLAANEKESDKYSVNIKTTATLPAQREAGKDEKPEDKDRLDKEFKAKLDQLKEKLAKEASFDKWLYVMNKYAIDSILKSRKDLLKEKKAEATPAPAAATTPAPVPNE